MIKNMKRGQIILAATVFVAAIVALFVGIQTAKEKSQARATATEIVQKSDDLRSQLLALYKERVKLATDLLAASSAAPLDKQWTRTEQWKIETAEELAAFDSIQSQISNHIAQKFSKIDIYGAKKQSKAAVLLRDFEKFEQDIVRKRSDYARLASDFAVKNNGNFPSDRVPQFPAELALQGKTNTK